MPGRGAHGSLDYLRSLLDRRQQQSDRYLVRAATSEELLAEARDLLDHTGRHTKRPGEAEFPPCPGCDLEARIDAALARCPSCGWPMVNHRDGYCLAGRD